MGVFIDVDSKTFPSINKTRLQQKEQKIQLKMHFNRDLLDQNITGRNMFKSLYNSGNIKGRYMSQ